MTPLSPLDFVWLLPDEARRAPGALTPRDRAQAAERALDEAFGVAGAHVWGAPSLQGGERETGFRDYVVQAWQRAYPSGALCTLASVERWPEETPEQGSPNGNTVHARLPGGWFPAWALHEQISRALAPLGYVSMSLEWSSTAEEIFKRLEAARDGAALADLTARCEVVMRRVAASARGTLDLQRRPYLDLDALLALAPADLTRLWLPHNRLDAVPAGVQRFASLETLELYHNPLESLPEWLYASQTLRQLNLHNTPLMADATRAAALRARLPHVRIQG